MIGLLLIVTAFVLFILAACLNSARLGWVGMACWLLATVAT